METRALLFCLGIKERIEKEKDSRGLDSDCRKASTCDGHHGRIRTRIGPFKYFVESLLSLLSNGSDLTSISIRSQPQSSILYRDIFCPRCCIILFWPNGSCIKLRPLWTRLRVGARPPAPLWSSSHVLIPFSRCQEHLGFVFVELAIAIAFQRACWPNRPSDCLRNPTIL